MDGLILLSILLAQEIADQAAGPLRIEASVAFGGHVSASPFTELRVRAVSPHGGTLTLETVGGSPNVSFSLELPPGEPAETWVPLGVDFSKPPPTVRARLDDQDPQSVALDIIRHPGPRSILVGALATQLLLQVPDTESVSGTTLPRYLPAYSQISALAIDGRTLAALDDAQLRTLLEFAGACGRLLLIDASTSVERVFVNRAACEGRFLKIADSAGTAEAAFLELLEQPALALPSDEQLGRLLTGTFDGAFDFARLGLFWAGYLIVLIVLVMQARTRVAALGFSIVATLLVLVIWPPSTSRAYVAWAEASSIDRVARYAGLERHSVTRRGALVLPADSFGIHPVRIAGSDYALRWSADTDHRSLVWDASPFQQIDKLTRSSFPVDSLLRVAIRDNIVSVCNSGIGASRQAFLHWQGNVYAIPSMAPGTIWSSTDQAALDADSTKSPELQLFLQRSFGHTMTLLQSLPISNGNKKERAWLLRYASDQIGDSPCGI